MRGSGARVLFCSETDSMKQGNKQKTIHLLGGGPIRITSADHGDTKPHPSPLVCLYSMIKQGYIRSSEWVMGEWEVEAYAVTLTRYTVTSLSCD